MARKGGGKPGKLSQRTFAMLKQISDGIDVVVEEELQENYPPETRMTLNRLRAEGFSEGQARGMIARAHFVELLLAEKAGEPFSEVRYVENLLALPEPVDIENRDAARR